MGLFRSKKSFKCKWDIEYKIMRVFVHFSYINRLALFFFLHNSKFRYGFKIKYKFKNIIILSNPTLNMG